MEERLQKLLSAAGVCSRRAAEDYLNAGRVTVNGETARLGQKADPDRDEICVDGAPLRRPEQMVYLMLNKPRGYVTTLSDEQGRPTVAELTANVGVRVYPVGRLDLDSEGLLLLTNDGALTARLLHPSHEVDKTYRVQVYGPVAGADRRAHGHPVLWGAPSACLGEMPVAGGATRSWRSMTTRGNRRSGGCSARCDLGVKGSVPGPGSDPGRPAAVAVLNGRGDRGAEGPVKALRLRCFSRPQRTFCRSGERNPAKQGLIRDLWPIRWNG